jgi:hypothetical protein
VVITPPPSGPPDPQEVKFCNDLNKAKCDKANTCLPYVLKALYGDVATCVAREGLLCASQVAVAGSTVTAAMQTSCTQALTAQSCDDYYNDVAVPACDFKGAGANGSACISGRQCQTGNCVALGGQSCGACAAFLPSGAPCNAGSACAPGLACLINAQGTSGLCGPLGKAGGACVRDSNCAYGLLCAAGKCAGALAAGTACNPADDLCNFELGLYCDPTSSKCVELKYAAAGQPCDDLTQCLASSDCPASNSPARTCTPPAKEGEACSQTKGCLPPSGCARDGICHLPQPLVCM